MKYCLKLIKKDGDVTNHYFSSYEELDYKQGYNDAIKTACNVFCYTGCPHKTDFYNCLNDKCDTWKIFKRMMEEQL